MSVLIYQETGLQTSCEFQRVELSFGMFMYQLTYVQSYEQHLSRFGLNFNQTDLLQNILSIFIAGKTIYKVLPYQIGARG